MKTIKLGTALLSTLALASAGLTALAQGQVTPPFKGAAVPKPRQQTNKAQNDKREKGPGDYLVSLPLEVLDMYLKLTKEQSGKIAPILKKVKTEQSKFLSFGAGGGVPDKEKLEAQFKTLAETVRDGEKEAEGLLTEDQKKKELTMFDEVRQFGYVGVPRDAIAEVKLTEDQKKKLLALADEYQKKRAEIKPEDRQTEGVRLGKEYRDKAAALLTADQQQVVEKARQNSMLRPKAQ